MAARLRKLHQDDVRSKIQTSQIINRLTDHGFGKVDLSPSQVQALSIVLKKSLPDLASVELSGNKDAPIVTRIELVDGDGTD
jgi:hypothetical protein